MNIATMIPLLLGILLNCSAQLLLKAGMDKIGYFAFTLRNVVPVGMQIAFNPYIIAGLSCYVISVGVWLMGLSRVDVSVAYPMVSLGYVIAAVVAYFFMNESLSLTRVTGIFVILVGVYLVSRTGATS